MAVLEVLCLLMLCLGLLCCIILTFQVLCISVMVSGSVFMVFLCVCEPDVSDPICGFGAFPLALSLLFVLFHLILF